MNRFVICCAAFLALSFCPPVLAQTPEQPPRIVVTGEGETSIAPDMAVLSVAVLREAKTARQAVSASNEAMTGVIEAMKAAGVAERDLQTSGFSITPRYIHNSSNDRNTAPEIAAYSVTNSLVIRVRDLTRLGRILDTAVSLGVNQGGDIRFTNDDPSAAITGARINAVADAIAKARTLAEAAGVSTGRILEISEQVQHAPPMPLMRARSAAAESGDVPVQSGENTYHVQVNVIFAISQ